MSICGSKHAKWREKDVVELSYKVLCVYNVRIVLCVFGDTYC